MTLDELIQHDNKLILEEIENSMSLVIKIIKSSSIPKTLESLCMLQMSINFLKTAVFDLAKADNLYAMSVVQRSLYEHAVRHLYISTRYMKEKNDNVGKEYYKWNDIKEYIDYFQSIKKQSELEHSDDDNISIEEILEEVYSGYAEIPKKERIQKIQGLSFFNLLKTVLIYIIKVKGDIPILNNLPSDYSILSSFVHGGPHANRLQMFNSNCEAERKSNLFNGCKKVFFLSSLCLMNTLIVAGQFDKKLLRYVQIIKKRILEVP